MRLRAIACAFFYGLAPSRLYEPTPHYAPMSYLAHLAMNLAYGFRWLTFRETQADIDFEQEVNSMTRHQRENLALIAVAVGGLAAIVLIQWRWS